MVATWIEQAAKGRHGGPVRAGMWSSVVVGTHPIEANQDVWLEISVDDVAARPAARVLDREQGGQQPLARADSAPGGRRPAPLSLGGAEPGVGAGLQPAQDTIVRPNLPDRSESSEIVGPESRGAGRQPDDDGAGRRPGLDLRPLLPDRRHALRRPARRGRPGPRAGRTSARSSAAWRSAAGSTGSPSGSAGRRSSTTRGPRTS